MSSKTGLDDGEEDLGDESELEDTGGGATMLVLITGWPLTRFTLDFFPAVVDFETTLGILSVCLLSVTIVGVFLGKGVTVCWRGLTCF